MLTQKEYDEALNKDMVIYEKLPEDVKSILRSAADVQYYSELGNWVNKRGGVFGMGTVYRSHPDTLYVSKTVTQIKGLSLVYHNTGKVHLVFEAEGMTAREYDVDILASKYVSGSNAVTAVMELNRPKAEAKPAVDKYNKDGVQFQHMPKSVQEELKALPYAEVEFCVRPNKGWCGMFSYSSFIPDLVYRAKQRAACPMCGHRGYICGYTKKCPTCNGLGVV